MKVVIVDDEWYGLDLTYRLLTQVRQDLEAVAFFQDPFEALEQIPVLKPHLVILDAEMPFINGFELYERLKELKTEFWMVSAHDDRYIRNGVKNKNVRILVKPFCKADISTLFQQMCLPEPDQSS